MLGVVACAWRVKSVAGSQSSDHMILELSNISILNSNIIINDETIIYNSGYNGILFLIKENIGVILKGVFDYESETELM